MTLTEETLNTRRKPYPSAAWCTTNFTRNILLKMFYLRNFLGYPSIAAKKTEAEHITTMSLPFRLRRQLCILVSSSGEGYHVSMCPPTPTPLCIPLMFCVSLSYQTNKTSPAARGTRHRLEIELA